MYVIQPYPRQFLGVIINKLSEEVCLIKNNCMDTKFIPEMLRIGGAHEGKKMDKIYHIKIPNHLIGPSQSALLPEMRFRNNKAFGFVISVLVVKWNWKVRKNIAFIF